MGHDFTHERYERMTPEKYMRLMRNANKRAYAEQFWAWLNNGEQGPEPRWYGISYLAAQAVRINLYDFRKYVGAEAQR